MPWISLALGLSLLISEVSLAMRRKAHESTEKKDQGSLKTLWRIIILSITIGVTCAFMDIGPRLPQFVYWRNAGIVFFLVGAGLRWWSILHLGRFFTVDVAVAEDHRLIDDGPYRFIRHPSYTGLLLEFTGIALSLGYVATVLFIFVPIFWVFSHRIRIEEEALSDKFGEHYRSYAARTKRLLPFLY